MLHWLRARQPDVVGIQELKLEDEQLSHRRARRGRVPVGRLLPARVERRRDPGAAADRGGAPGPARPGRTGRSTVDRAGGRPRVHDALHSQRQVRGARGLPAQARVARRARRPSRARARPSRAAVRLQRLQPCARRRSTAGTKSAPLQGAIFHTDEERSRFQRLLDWGLVDVYRRLRPTRRRSRGRTTAPATSTATRGCASTSCWRRRRSPCARSPPTSIANTARRRTG